MNDYSDQKISFRSLLVAAAAILLAGLSAARGFPAKPVTMVVPNPPGGLVDASARLPSQPLSRVTGRSVVDNKGGGSGNVAYDTLVKR